MRGFNRAHSLLLGAAITFGSFRLAAQEASLSANTPSDNPSRPTEEKVKADEHSVTGPHLSEGSPSTAKTVTMIGLYGASVVSLVLSGVYTYRSFDRGNLAETERDLAPVGFCQSMVSPECRNYYRLREEQSAYALRAWGFLAASSLLALGGLGVSEFWPNQRPSIGAYFNPGPEERELGVTLTLEL